jgi:hypothetical protein
MVSVSQQRSAKQITPPHRSDPEQSVIESEAKNPSPRRSSSSVESFFVSSRPESAERRDPGFRPRAPARPPKRKTVATASFLTSTCPRRGRRDWRLRGTASAPGVRVPREGARGEVSAHHLEKISLEMVSFSASLAPLAWQCQMLAVN